MTPSRALLRTLSVTTNRTADNTNATVASVAMSVPVTNRGGVRNMRYFSTTGSANSTLASSPATIFIGFVVSPIRSCQALS